MSSTVTREDLLGLPIFKGLSNEELELLQAHVAPVEFDTGEEVLREGEQNDRLLCILAGRLRVWRKGTPTDLILAEVGPGEVIGELSFLEPGPATATVSALEGGRAVAISSGDLSKLEEAHPSAAIAFYRRLARTLRQRLAETTAFVSAYKGIQQALTEVEELRYSLGKLL